MATGTEYPPFLFMLEEGYSEGNATRMRDDKSETIESIKVVSTGKPPRQLPPIRHCMSSAQLPSAADLVRKPLLSGCQLRYLSIFFHIEFLLHLICCLWIPLLRNWILGWSAQSHHQMEIPHLNLFFVLEAVRRLDQNHIWRMSTYV